MESRKIIGLLVQVGQLHGNVGFIEVKNRATDMFPITESISQYIKSLLAKAKTISSIDASLVAIAEIAKNISAVAADNVKHRRPVEAPFVVARVVTLLPMSETPIQVKSSLVGVHVVQFQKTLTSRHQKLVAQSIVGTVSRIPFRLKVASQPISFIQLLRHVEAVKCSPAPPVRFELIAEQDNLGSTNDVQIYKAQRR